MVKVVQESVILQVHLIADAKTTTFWPKMKVQGPFVLSMPFCVLIWINYQIIHLDTFFEHNKNRHLKKKNPALPAPFQLRPLRQYNNYHFLAFLLSFMLYDIMH